MNLRRVVVTLDGSSPATLTRMIDLARGLEAELVGLLVEDTELLSLAALPFGETGFPTAVRRPLDVEAMERSLRAKARRIEQELGARLAGNSVRWTFEVVRGRLASALMAVAAEGDIVVVPVARAIAGAPGARTRAAREYRALSVPWLLVCDPLRGDDWIAIVPPTGAAMQSVAQVVVALAPHHGRSALFVLDESDAAHGEPWRRDLQHLLAEHAVSVRFRVLAGDTPAALDRLIVDAQPGIVVVLASTTASRDALLA